MFSRSFVKRALAGLAIAGCLLAGLPAIALAQGGITIFSGVARENQLKGWAENGKSGTWDRYYLEIPSKKMKLAIAQISITYPKYYKGEFDIKEVEVRVKNKAVKLQEVNWDKENQFLEIYPEEPIPAGGKVQIILSNVKNPSFGGMFYFNCRIQAPGDVPIYRYLGTWIMSIT
ncbi:MAG: DUF2808 domain-containing protein [Scytolyngbya sp. HA4215-MV1]|nr:DUF2808 domain-containing protein [Scytolyngbya sp. HA4215-MV1]